MLELRLTESPLSARVTPNAFSSQRAEFNFMKVALCATREANAAVRLARAMSEAQRHEEGCVTREFTFGFGAFAIVSRPGETENDLLAWTANDGSFFTLAGTPFVMAQGANQAAFDRIAAGVLDGELLAQAITELEGAFVAVAWHAQRAELSIVTDFLGVQPLYRADRSGTVMFASELKAFGRAGALTLRADAAGWGATLLFGHPIGSQTQLAGVVRVEPALSLVATGPESWRSATTWTWPTSRRVAPDKQLLGELGDALRAEVGSISERYPSGAMLFSGGFDSRLILCMLHERGMRPRVLLHGHPDENANADAVFGRAFAATLGLPVTHTPARENYFASDNFLEYLERTDIITPSLYLFIANILPLVRQERHGLWEGVMLGPALKFDYGGGGFAPYIASRIGPRRIYRDAVRTLFSAAWAAELEQAYDELVKGECSRYSDDADGVWQFSVVNRSRFRTGSNPFQVYDAVTASLTPGISRRFWQSVIDVEPSVRFGQQLYRSVFDHLAPAGRASPVASGADMIPGTGRHVLYRQQRTQAAVQRLLRRPKVRRALTAMGAPLPFTWRTSPFPDIAVDEAALDSQYLNADWVRLRRSGAARTPADDAAAEVLMYWQGWHHMMRGPLVETWGELAQHQERSAAILAVS